MIRSKSIIKKYSRKKQDQKQNVIQEETRITEFNRLLPLVHDTTLVVACMENRGAYPFSYEINDMTIGYWTQLKHIVHERIQSPSSFVYEKDRVGYHLSWENFPLELRRYVLNDHIKTILQQYMKNPYLLSVEIHANKNTSNGRSKQVIHRDILTNSNDVVTIMIMLDPTKSVGTYIIPGTHKFRVEVPQTLYEISERVTYTHHAVMFDSSMCHYGPATTKTVYKLSMVFVTKEAVVNRMEQLINDLFSNTAEVKQNIDTLLLIMPLSTM
jgi:hypothetical protein